MWVAAARGRYQHMRRHTCVSAPLLYGKLAAQAGAGSAAGWVQQCGVGSQEPSCGPDQFVGNLRRAAQGGPGAALGRVRQCASHGHRVLEAVAAPSAQRRASRFRGGRLAGCKCRAYSVGLLRPVRRNHNVRLHLGVDLGTRPAPEPSAKTLTHGCSAARAHGLGTIT